MALTLHADIELTIGDDWQIEGTLLDANGVPLNLVPTVLLGWTLLGPDGEMVIDLNQNVEIERPDPVTSGKVLINVSSWLTRRLRPVRYTDSIRAWVGDAPSTMWRGLILAAADPFHSEVVT